MKLLSIILVGIFCFSGLNCIAEEGIPPVGVFPNFQLTKRLYKTPKDYFKGKRRSKMENYVSSNNTWIENDKDRKKAAEYLNYDIKQMTAYVYVPETYDGGDGWGMFLHITPGARGHMPGSWRKLMDEYKLIYVCASGTQNGQPFLRRMGIALDAMASVEAKYNIDPKRRIVSGLSGGGLKCMLVALNYPEFFEGAISHAAQVFVKDMPGKESGSWVRYLSDKDRLDIAEYPIRWAFITGEKDFNYKAIKKCFPGWTKAGFDARLFDQPGMGHSVCSAEWLDKILSWIEEKKNKAVCDELDAILKTKKWSKAYLESKEILKEAPPASIQYKKAEKLIPELLEKGKKSAEALLADKKVKNSEMREFILEWGDSPFLKDLKEKYNANGSVFAEKLLAAEKTNLRSMKSFLNYWSDYPCSAQVKEKYNEIGKDVLEKLQNKKAGTVKLRAFAINWNGYSCAEELRVKLDKKAQKEFARLEKRPNLTPVALCMFMKKWKTFPTAEKAHAKLCEMAEANLKEILQIDKTRTKKSKLSLFIRNYKGTPSIRKAKKELAKLKRG